MASIFGHLNISDSDRVWNSTVGQGTIFEAATAYLNRVNEEINRATSLFVARTTEGFKLRYKLPGSGYLQRRGPDGRYGSVKAYGSWDVAFPLEDFGAQISGNDVDMAYMTVAELNRHIETVVQQNINTVRFEMLKAIFNNGQDTFVDPLNGSLSIEPLANGDAVVYPPIITADTEATEDHYYRSGYATASISDTNDPLATMVTELSEHFGDGVEIVTFVNSAEVAKLGALAKFVDVLPNQINAASTAATVAATLSGVPGKVIGFHSDGTWVVQWDRGIPATYMVGVCMDVEAPLVRRIDPADTGLGNGLQLVAQDQEFPFSSSFWRHRFGFGAANRLNGAVLQMATAAAYDVPNSYA